MATKYKLFLIALVFSLGIDQATKVWARAELKPKYPEVISVVPGFWEFRYSENPGSAFGLFRGIPHARYFLFVVGMAALAVIGSYLRKAPPEARRLAAELGLLAGGALGNITDRIMFGRVTDFVVWKAGTYEWPTFNVADAALVVGVVGLLFDLRPPASASQQAKKRA